MGVDIKVETHGSDGIKNRLTAEEIEKANGVIVAVGKNVPMGRFSGKPTLERPVADGIKKSEELINEAISGNAPIYRASKSDQDNETTDQDDQDRSPFSLKSIYHTLMNGVSTMLPFVIAGGIILALSYLFEGFVADDYPILLVILIFGDTQFGS